MDKLEAEIARLRGKLQYQELTGKEEPFGSSTPSSKEFVKKNSDDEKANKEKKKEIIEVADPDLCTECGADLIGSGYRKGIAQSVCCGQI